MWSFDRKNGLTLLTRNGMPDEEIIGLEKSNNVNCIKKKLGNIFKENKELKEDINKRKLASVTDFCASNISVDLNPSPRKKLCTENKTDKHDGKRKGQMNEENTEYKNGEKVLCFWKQDQKWYEADIIEKRSKVLTYIQQSMKIDLLAVVLLLNGILIDASCPARCACGNSVNGVNLYCYGRNLEYVPNIPNDTHELTLASNKISIIKQFAFVNLPGLHDINIADNLITAIEEYAFVGMPSLHFAKMDNNMLTTIRAHTFDATDIRDGMNLTSNPINCDCGVYPLWSWIIERQSMNAEATCSNGTLITSLGSSELEKCNPDNCQCLNDGKCVMTGGGKVICDCIEHWTGEMCQGIVWANGHQWLELNKLIIQAQHKTTVIENMQQQLTLEVNKLCQCFSPNDATDPLDHLFNSTLNIMSILAFGKRLEYENPDFTTLRARVKYIFKHGQSLGRKETLFSWLALFTKSQVSEVIGEMDKLHAFIKQKLENHVTDNNSKFPLDLLDVYLNLSDSERKDSALSERNFFQAIIDMYIAAYETYTGTLMTLMFHLLKYPDVQTKCREEIHRVCGGKQTVTIEDRDELRYVESTIKEVLRIAKPVVLAIYRTIPREIKVEKYTIPAESIILFDLNDPQIDPKLWDNPNEFDPDRWETPQKNGYLPFGIGPRRCVGAPTVELSLFFMFYRTKEMCRCTNSRIVTFLYDNKYTK
ncbi:Hypothetical predicted protein [Mytilus galloprovincialis]|uniref:EGF-like domain-containing protein n=1 Tax=Mytilus galloprovincialis TaxID=29158 RepID=A0A8B6H043_MYTGA|nr:Hypothetical predicted protein [Mytilus galloprovincialis]